MGKPTADDRADPRKRPGSPWEWESGEALNPGCLQTSQGESGRGNGQRAGGENPKECLTGNRAGAALARWQSPCRSYLVVELHPVPDPQG